MSDHDSHGSSAHSSNSHDGAHGSQDDHSHGGTKQYMMVFVALCVLTSMSFFTYSSLWPFHDTPAIGWTFMMAVSLTKALLVMLFFMHLLWEASWKFVLTIPCIIMSFFLVLSLVGDVGQRTRYYEETRWLNASVPVEGDGHHGDGHAEDKDGHGHSHDHDHGKDAHADKKGAK